MRFQTSLLALTLVLFVGCGSSPEGESLEGRDRKSVV